MSDDEAKISPTQVVKVVEVLLESVRLEVKSLRDDLRRLENDHHETRKILFALHERLDEFEASVSRRRRL